MFSIKLYCVSAEDYLLSVVEKKCKIDYVTLVPVPSLLFVFILMEAPNISDGEVMVLRAVLGKFVTRHTR